MKNIAQAKILNTEQKAHEIATILNEIHNLLTSNAGHNLTHERKEQIISRLCVLTEKNTTYYSEISSLAKANNKNFLKAIASFFPEICIYSYIFFTNLPLSFLIGILSIKYLANKAKDSFEPFRETKKVINKVYEESQSNAHRIINYEEILLNRMNHEPEITKNSTTDFENKISIANYYIDLAISYYLDLDVVEIPEDIKRIIIVILQDVLQTNESDLQILFNMARQTVAYNALENTKNNVK